MKKDIKDIVNAKSLEGIASLIKVFSNSDEKGEIFNIDNSKEKFNELIEEALKNGVIGEEEASKYLENSLITEEERKENFEKVKQLCEKATDIRRGAEIISSSNKQKGDVEHE